MRGNRFLGSALVDKKLLSTEDLEAANDRFMESAQENGIEQLSLLAILLYEKKTVAEDTLLAFYRNQLKMALLDPTHLAALSAREMGYDLALAKATLTVPFDRQDGFVCVASAYFLSNPVVKAWEELYNEKLLWYAASLRGIMHYIERVESIAAAEADADADMLTDANATSAKQNAE
jgi:hypothetical protein